MRYAAYVRVSSEEQVGSFSIAAQKRAIKEWVRSQGGELVQEYIDEGQSGRTADRPAFKRLRAAARAGQFDAIVVRKFDRFARNRSDALALKLLLRHEYGIQVFSVTEPVEEHDGPMGALLERLIDTIADWYSQNLSEETAKGKRERSRQGLHNNRAPFGMKKGPNKVLVGDDAELPGLILAFETYATGRHSDADVAQLLNERGFRSKTGRRFSKDTVRDILRNRTYLGEVKYQEYRRHSDGSRSFAAPVKWYKGRHAAVIDADLFERCQQARSDRAGRRKGGVRNHFYLLRDLVYCARCLQDKPTEKTFAKHGKMRIQARSNRNLGYYRCRTRELGYSCEQLGVRVEVVDAQVIALLKECGADASGKRTLTANIQAVVEERQEAARLAGIRGIVRAMDARWDHGFITDEQQFIEQRLTLQKELEKVEPLQESMVPGATDLLTDFAGQWDLLEGLEKEQQALIRLLVDRVEVHGDRVTGIILKGNHRLIPRKDGKGPTF